MASYHLWHPAYIFSEPLTIECFVTLGDAIFLSHGTDSFIRASLQTIGVSVEPATWQFDAMRTHYFSSYRGVTNDWEDDWALAWRIRVTLEVGDPPPLLRCPNWGYFDLDAVDKTFNPLDRPQLWKSWPGLILADAPSFDVIDNVREIVQRHCPQANCVLGKAFSRDPQLRCDLGIRERSFFESGAGEFEALLAQLADAGAYMHFDDALRGDVGSPEEHDGKEG